MSKKTLGEIVASHGFNSVSEYFDAVNALVEVEKSKSFNVGDSIKLKQNFKPTHFKHEEVLPQNTMFIVTEKSGFTLNSYHVKIHGYDTWFNASVFEATT
jgi:hypothetical protein